MLQNGVRIAQGVMVTQRESGGGRKVRRVRPPRTNPHPGVQVSGPRPRLIGREAELRYLRLVLRRKDTRLLTLTGSPGVGKTSLAVSAATQAARAFVHGVWFVDLAPLSDPM